MHSRTTPFILVVLGGALTTALVLPSTSSATGAEELTAIVVLALLALGAELLAWMLPKGARGSIASMPALAAILISPSWQAIAAIAVVKAFVESTRRVEFEKAIFNISQFALSFGLAALVYLQFGGESLLTQRADTLSVATWEVGLPAFAAFTTAIATNHLLVNWVIALSTGANLSSVWHGNMIATIGLDVIASPLIFLFAWTYIKFGPIASAALWIPIIGIRQLYTTNLELERTNVELLDLMVKSIEARDPYTSGHSRRVQQYSIVIARALGLPEKQIEMIGRAALLHDVGKIHEKYGPILRKADRLTAEEWTTMREHPVDGADLIATMTRLRELVGAVRHHHENWDGSGYPDGLTGEVIPVAARIIRFADTIDAMTTERPYRRLLSQDEVRAEIVRCRGTQFDPHIVDRLLSSPAWRTMFAPQLAEARVGRLSIVPGDRSRAARV